MKTLLLLVVSLFIGGSLVKPIEPTTVLPTTQQSVEVGIVPQKIIIEKTNVEAEVEIVGLNSAGRMDVPKRDENVAWYELGARPGEVGSAVIAGHFDTAQGTPAVFYDLDELVAGDQITIADAQGNTRKFTVERSQVYPDISFPLELVFAQADQARLNLITCDGIFDATRQNYSDRLVVFAVLLQ